EIPNEKKRTHINALVMRKDASIAFRCSRWPHHPTAGVIAIPVALHITGPTAGLLVLAARWLLFAGIERRSSHLLVELHSECPAAGLVCPSELEAIWTFPRILAMADSGRSLGCRRWIES